MNIKKLFSLNYYHRRFYAWLKKRKSPMYAWIISKERYYNETGRKLDYRHPKDINQKLMWLNRYSTDSRRGQYADKYLVRSYIIQCGFKEILIPLIGVWDSADKIDFSTLPNSFVLKCNHGSAYNIICRNKSVLNVQDVKKQLNQWLNENYDCSYQERHYRTIRPMIICEAFLEQLNGGIVDYKFNCFNGKVHSCFVAYDRSENDPHGSVNFDHYDINWRLTDAIKPEYHKNRRLIPRPECYNEMLKICSVLSSGFPFVRVDLYEVDGRVYFGELTFTPNGNIMSFYTQEMLDELGRQLVLPS